MLQDLPPIKDNKVHVSYNVNTLFVNIPLIYKIEYVLHKTCNEKLLQPIFKKNIIRRLFYKLTTECTFQFSFHFLKQIDVCAMIRSMLVVLADIHMVRLGNTVLRPLIPSFYKWLIDDIYTKCNKNGENILVKISK